MRTANANEERKEHVVSEQADGEQEKMKAIEASTINQAVLTQSNQPHTAYTTTVLMTSVLMKQQHVNGGLVQARHVDLAKKNSQYFAISY